MRNRRQEYVLVLLFQLCREQLLLLGNVHEYYDVHLCVHYLHLLENERVGILTDLQLVVLGVETAAEVAFGHATPPLLDPPISLIIILYLAEWRLTLPSSFLKPVSLRAFLMELSSLKEPSPAEFRTPVALSLAPSIIRL